MPENHKNDVKQKLTKTHVDAMKKHGGFPGQVTIRDQENGEVLYDNRDAHDMAIQSVKSKYMGKWEDEDQYKWEVLMDDHKCDKCDSFNRMYLQSIYFRPARCPSCGDVCENRALPLEKDEIYAIITNVDEMYKLPSFQDAAGKREKQEWERTKDEIKATWE